jgi:uncharacterized protein (TIGR02421 family)
MSDHLIAEFSGRLKFLAKDLSFLARPRYPLQQLNSLFPQHKSFIQELEDIHVPFSIDLKQKHLEIDQLFNDLTHADLTHDIKSIFIKRVEDYKILTEMMENFHSAKFYDLCTKLYGSSHKIGHNIQFQEFLGKIPHFCIEDIAENKLAGDLALKYLKDGLINTFGDIGLEVKPSHSLLSDSSAGRKTLKLNPNKSYSTQQLDIFLVHEGWVHLGTSLNGAFQTRHPWLASWAPRTTYLQEGLAVLTELITQTMTKQRWDKVLLRHLATSMAEKGSGASDIYAFLRHQNLDELDAFKLTLRIFRGVPLDGGMAFTKELLYLHGMVKLLNHLNLNSGDLKNLWVGKIGFEEHDLLMANDQIHSLSLPFFPKKLLDPEVKARLIQLQSLANYYLKDFDL